MAGPGNRGKLVMQRHPTKPRNGFSLILLIVAVVAGVIILLAVLAAVVVFAVGGAEDKNTSEAVFSDARAIRTAEEAFCAKNGRYGTVEELVSQRLLSEPSRYTTAIPGPGGACSGANVASQSGFSIYCRLSEPSCTQFPPEPT